MTEWRFRPARDHALGARARLTSGVREPGLGSVAITTAWRACVRAYFRLAHPLHVSGREHLPAPPFVLVANHASHLDALALSAALPLALAGRTYAMAAADTFFTSLPAAVFAAYAINALPVWRRRTSGADIAVWRARLLDDGAALILFPEGTRTRDGTMGRFRPGIGTLVAGHPIPVVPCHLDGAWRAWPPSRRLPRPGALRLAIGAPLRFDDHPADRDGALAVTRACEAAVRALAPGAVAPSGMAANDTMPSVTAAGGTP